MSNRRSLLRKLATVAFLVTGSACQSGFGVGDTAQRPSPALYAALDTLLQSEREAESRYGQVLRRFGTVEPFARLSASQPTRTEALVRIYLTYGSFPPANPYNGAAQPYVAYPTVTDACGEALAAAEELLGKYDKALALKPPAEVTRIWTQNRLRVVKETIPAAKACR